MDSPSDVWYLPTQRIGKQVFVFDSLDSTNDFVKRHASSLADGTVVLARDQTAGRGQFGRSWLSPAGAGVYMSIKMSMAPELSRPVVFTAWAGVSIAEAIRPLVGRQPALKWPNDVLIRGRKIAGILIEQGPATVVGVGVNVNQSATQLLADGLTEATSMSNVADRIYDVDEVALHVIQQFDSEWDSILNGELAVLESCWKWRMGLLGRHVTVRLYNGEEIMGRLCEMQFAGLNIESTKGRLITVPPETIRNIAEHQQFEVKNLA